MEYLTFLDAVIKRGIQAATRDYAEHPEKLAGAISGFEACRDRSPGELGELLAQARKVTWEARLDARGAGPEASARLRRLRCHEAEIEWVCNCVSCLGEGVRIVPPTARAMITVAQIVGVAAPD